MKSRPKTIRFYASLLSIALLAAGICWWAIHLANPPADTRITIRYSLDVQNTTNRPLKQAKISLFAPVSRTSTQQCSQNSASHPFVLTTAASGNQALEIQWDMIAPHATKIVSIQSQLNIWRDPQKIGQKDLGPFLQPEPLIESEDPSVRALAEKLTKKNRTQTVRNIFEWVADNIEYSGYVRRNRGARYALAYRRGDCTEYASLFVALCRANKIPARPVGGFICPRSMAVDLNDYHNWAEFYLNGRWRTADPQNNKFMTDESQYIAFEIIQPSQSPPSLLVSKIEGAGLEVKFKRKRYSRKQS